MGSTTGRSAARLAILFALVSGLWIMFSDLLLGHLTSDPVWLTRLQTVKGGVFVGATAILLYFLLQRELGQLERRDEQIREIGGHLQLQGTALESAANAILITDRAGRITWVNPAFTRLTGYAAAEVLGLHPRLLKSGRHDRAFYQEMWETILSGRVWRGEMVNRRKDGSLYTEEQTITPVREAGGEISHFIGIKQDITQRKRAEEALRASEEKFRNLVEKTSDWVWEIDERNRYTYVSPRIREILGYAPEEVLGKTPFDLMPVEEAKRVAEVFAPITGQMQPFVLLDNICLHKDGRRIVLETGGTPVIDAQGVFRGYRGIDRDVTERQRAREALAERTRQLEAVQAVSTEMTRELDLTNLLDLVHRRAAELVEAKRGTVFLWDEADQRLVPQAWHGYEVWVGDLRLRLGEGAAGTVAERRAGMIVNDYRNSPFAHPLFLQHGLDASVLCEPLLYRDRLLGAILLAGPPRKRPFSVEDQQLLRLFADHAAIAIENARLHSAAVQRSGELEALLRATRSVMSGLDLQAILDRILAEAAEISGCAHVKVLLVDKEAGRLRVGAVQGTAMGGEDRLPLGRGHSGIVAATGEVLFCADCPNDPRNAYAARDRELGIVTYLGLPIKSRDEVIGVLSFNTTAPRHYTQAEIAYLSSFAAQAAIAIENARLHETTERRAQQLAMLTELTRVLTTTLEPQTAAREILAAVQVLIPGAAGRLWEWAEGEEVLRTMASVGLRDPEGALAPVFRPREGMTGIAAATRQPIASLDVSRDPRFRSKAWAAAEGIVSCIVLPLLYGGRVTGVLSIYTHEPHEFTDEEVRLLCSFTAQAAIAIENARLHAETRQHAARLEQRVQERTRELEEARAQAEEVSRHKSEFLANMSHELRTPLTSIIGFSQILQEGHLSEKQAQCAAHIHHAGAHLIQLVNDVLDLSKVEAGKLTVQPEPVPVASTLEDFHVMACALANKKTQTLELEVEPDLPPVRVDPMRFKQICLNLLSNAVKFTPNGGRITLTARKVNWSSSQMVNSPLPVDQSTTRPIDTAGDCLEIQVSDTGVGIRPDDLARLFQEFTQLEPAGATPQEGTGLGLALTKRLVELHGGQIWAASEGEGRGSTFTVRLPFAQPGK
jgi:PAS domain S-box-containing protein